MMRYSVLDSLLEQKNLMSVRSGSVHKWMELDQIFRLMLGGFLLLLIYDMFGGFRGERPWMFSAVAAYLVLNAAFCIGQNLWSGLRAMNDWRMCAFDLFFFAAFLIIGGDISHLLNLNFLFVSFCIGLKLGTRRGTALLTLTVLTFIGVKLFFEFQEGTLRIVHVATWTLFLAAAGYFLAKLADGIRIEIEKAKLLRRMRSFISPGKGINVISDYITAEILRFFGAARASVLLFSEDGNDSLRAVHLDENREPQVVINGIPKRDMALLRSANPQRAQLYVRHRGREKVFEYWQKEWKEIPVFEDFDTLRPEFKEMTVAMVPLGEGDRVFGRLFVRGNENNPLSMDDVWFILKVVDQLGLYLENTRLAEHIAEDAASVERRRIALDLHDSIVQPYIGLQLGISALKNKTETDKGVGATDVERLDLLAKDGIENLRDYVRTLRDETRGDWSLTSAVERYIRKFSEATGIAVEFDHDLCETKALPDQLSADIFQMICEGVSNARKHTDSKCIRIAMCDDGWGIQISIEDEGRKDGTRDIFVPQSISQRAAFYGGTVRVTPATAGGVRIDIEIPTNNRL